MRAWGALVAVASVLGCRGLDLPSLEFATDAAGSDGARLACPDGMLPTPGDASPACPPSLPTPGSCCSPVGLKCTYPWGDVGHIESGCVDDGIHAPFWSQDTVLDDPCKAATGAPLPGSDAASCDARASKACNVNGAGSQQGALNAQILDLVAMCHGELTGECEIEVWFQDGCATAMTQYGIAGIDVGCFTAGLESARWLCAVGLECAGFAFSTLQ